MSNVSVTLLTASDSYDYTGTQAPSDAYYGFTDGLHTVSIDPTVYYCSLVALESV